MDSDEELLLDGLGRRNDVWVTSHRLIQQQGGGILGGQLRIAELPLEEITEMSIGFIRNMSLLVLGTALVLFGVVSRAALPSEIGDVSWMAGIIVTIYFVLSGRRGIVVKSQMQQLKIKTGGVKANDVREFVFTLESARNSLMEIEGDPEDAGIRAGGLRKPDDAAEIPGDER